MNSLITFSPLLIVYYVYDSDESCDLKAKKFCSIFKRCPSSHALVLLYKAHRSKVQNNYSVFV